MSDDAMDEDYELQLALALSMQDYGGGDPQAAAAAPAPQQPAAAAPAQAHQGGVPDLAAALAAALQAAVAGQAGAPGQPPQAQPYQQQHHHQQAHQQAHQQQRQQGPRPAAAAAPPPDVQLPPWVAQLGRWWATQQQGQQGQQPSDAQQQLLAQGEVLVPLPDVPAALKVLADMLQQPVVCPAATTAAAAAAAGGGAAAAAVPAGALWLTCLCPSGLTSARVRASDLDTLIATWLPRACSSARGRPQLLLLAGAAQRAPPLPPPSPSAPPLPAGGGGGGSNGSSGSSGGPAEGQAAPAALGALLGLRLASKACELLAEDEDDLFFEAGRTHSELLDALRNPSSGLSPGFLSSMLAVTSSPEGAACWAKVLTEALRGFAGYKLSGGVVELEPHMICLDRVTQDPRLLMQMAHTLANEVPRLLAPPRTPASLALQASLLAPLLAIHSAPDHLAVLAAVRRHAFFGRPGDGGGGQAAGGVSAAAAAMSPATSLFTGLRSYPRNAGEVDGARRVLAGMLGRVADAVAQVAKRLAGLKAPGVPANSGREVLLAWLAAVAASNEARCKGGEYSAHKYLQGAPDGPMLILTAAVLRLTKPFVSGYLAQNPKFQDLLGRHLNPTYYTTHAARLGSASTEPSLSGERGVAAAAAAAGSSGGGNSGNGSIVAADPAAAAAAASFISETFFLAQRYLHVGLLPSVYRFTKVSGYLRDMLRDQLAEEAEEGGGGGGGGRQVPPELSLYNDVATSQLLQPDMTADATQFAVLEIVWLADLLTKQQQERQAGGSSSSSSSVFSSIPEGVLSDAAAWLTFVINAREAEQLAAVDIGLLMRSLVTVLEHPSEVRSLLVVSKVIHLLLAMLAPQVYLQHRTRGALGRSYMSPGEMALVASVLGTSAAQQQLVPALMRVYGQADFVVGLDVDSDDYDKFSMRHEIDQLLLELWQDERCRGCIKGIAKSAAAAAAAAAAASAADSSGGGLFPSFVSAVLNDLMYLFKDSLERLADIKQIEDSKKDEKAWAALSDEARRDKETFYGGQQRTASGFMSYAKTTLDLLLTLTGDPEIAKAFLVQPLLGRTAYALLHFLELLVGPRCQDLDVANPQRYNFDRQALLLTLVQMAGNLAQHATFVQALGEEPDYEPSLLQSAVDLLNAQHAYTPADSLAAIAARIAAATRDHQEAKKQRRSLPTATGGADGVAGAGAAAAAAGPSAGGAAAAAAGGHASSSSIEAQIEALVARWGEGLGVDAPRSYEAAEGPYVAALTPLAVGVFDAGAPGAYNSQFTTMAQQAEGDSSQKLRRLNRELRDLRGKTALPIAAAAACFVMQDADRPDKVRCVITGPQDTPYEGGLFVFDVFFPPGYPNVPPLMVLDTTGGGRARFNPNLYADGKVCLSLLGTWHGADEASKWNPASSSLFQILLSIQGMIFVEDPYFNEPNVELMRGTSEGNLTSMRYNADLRVATLRWAVLAQLKKPPPGLEEVVRAHFRVLRGVLAARAGRWLREAAAADPSGTTFNRMADVIDDIMAAAAQL